MILILIVIVIVIVVVILIVDFDGDLASRPAVQERPVTGKQSWEEVVYLGGDWDTQGHHLGGEWDTQEGLTTTSLPPLISVKPLQLRVDGFCLSQSFGKPCINHCVDDRVHLLDPLDECRDNFVTGNFSSCNLVSKRRSRNFEQWAADRGEWGGLRDG